jgi:hypothetical protein
MEGSTRRDGELWGQEVIRLIGLKDGMEGIVGVW